ncbi:MAG TPA: hypothetical protein VHB79_08700 [Polyangiaceae bacterium]|nr:hypothetical protein [Polyangiaceae bacterium]
MEKYFPEQVTVYVAISARVAKTDSGNVAAMVDALEAELREAGNVVSIVGANRDEAPPVPRLEIQVRDSDSGDGRARGAGQLTQMLSPLTGAALVGAGSGNMVADVYIVDEWDHAHYVGHFLGGSFGATSEVEIAAGDRVGHEIAESLER